MHLFQLDTVARNRHLATVFVVMACLLVAISIDSRTAYAESNEATAIDATFGLEYAVPNGPRNLAAEGPGRIWYTATDADGIGFLEVITDTNSSAVRYRTEFYGFSENSMPYDLVYDDTNGVIWFTLRGMRSLGKIDVATREIDTFLLASIGAAPTGIDVDTIGRPWIAQSNGRISRFDPTTETFEEFLLPDALAATPRMEDLAYQSDRAIWMTMPDGNRVVIYNSLTDRFFDDPTGAPPLNISVDDQGQAWISVYDSSVVGRRVISTSSRWVWFNTPTPEGGPAGITAFTDELGVSQLWFAENKTGSIGRIQFYGTNEVANREKVGPAAPPGNTWGIIHTADGHIWVSDTTRNVIYELAPPYINRLYVARIGTPLP